MDYETDVNYWYEIHNNEDILTELSNDIIQHAQDAIFYNHKKESETLSPACVEMNVCAVLTKYYDIVKAMVNSEKEERAARMKKASNIIEC